MLWFFAVNFVYLWELIDDKGSAKYLLYNLVSAAKTERWNRQRAWVK